MPPRIAYARWLDLMGRDKKVRRNTLRFVLLDALGVARVRDDVTEDVARRARARSLAALRSSRDSPIESRRRSTTKAGGSPPFFAPAIRAARGPSVRGSVPQRISDLALWPSDDVIVNVYVPVDVVSEDGKPMFVIDSVPGADRMLV